MSDTMKCARCKNTKPLTEEFFPHNKRSPGGWDKRCKECWREIQREKRERKAAGGSDTASGRIKQNAERVVSKSKQVEESGKVAFKTRKYEVSAEIAPADLQVRMLTRLADLPRLNDPDDSRSAIEYFGWTGSLSEGIERFREEYGTDPVAVYIPATMFLRITPHTEGKQNNSAKGAKKE